MFRFYKNNNYLSKRKLIITVGGHNNGYIKIIVEIMLVLSLITLDIKKIKQ